jgi:hypothetical protein
MSADIMSGIIGGMAEAHHQKTLMDMQNTVAGNQLMMSQMLHEANNPKWLPQAQHGFMQAAMDMSQGLGKPQSKTMQKAYDNAIQIHVRPGDVGWQGGPPPTGDQTPPMAQSESMPQMSALGNPAYNQPVPAPQPPPEGLLRSGQWSPEEEMQQVAHGKGLETTEQQNALFQAAKQKFGFIESLPEEQQAPAAMALGLRPTTLATMPGEMKGEDLLAAGVMNGTWDGKNPFKPGVTYKVRTNPYNNQIMGAYPQATKAGPLHWAQNEEQQWVGYTTDPYSGKINVVETGGLTPPQGVPTDSINRTFKVMRMKDGSDQLVPITTTTERVKSGSATPAAPPPTAPPGMAPSATAAPAPAAAATAPGAGPVAAPSAPPTGGLPAATPQAPTAKPTKRAGGLGPGVGTPIAIPGAGQPMTAPEIETSRKEVGAYTNTMDRMRNILHTIQDPKFGFNSVIRRAGLTLAGNPDVPGAVKALYSTKGMSKRDAKFVGDYASLAEDINVLRQVFKAGFRGEEAFKVLTGQRGDLLQNPALFQVVLKNSLESVVSQMGAIYKTMGEYGHPFPDNKDIDDAYGLLEDNDTERMLQKMKLHGFIR